MPNVDCRALPSGAPQPAADGHKFGTFGGVFTPSILTIFGLIMFMRANQVIGTAGVLSSLFILTLASSITLLTGLSISSISSNTPVKGGGAYYLISRVLGPGFGTAIGMALFLAQAISVPFYILGFVEALVQTFPVLAPAFQALCLGVLLVLFILVWMGAGWVIRLQYVILAVLAASIATFLAGAWWHFDPQLFSANLRGDYSGGEDFWSMFALYFPAVTGIMAGVNMSGDLKNPGRSIPLGTLAAVLVGFAVYAAQIVLCGGLASREQLIAEPFLLLVSNALFGMGWLVVAGVFLATLSSAIGSNLGAPRVLQAVGRDRALAIFTPFAKGTIPGDEPRRALLLTFFIGVATLAVFGKGGGGAGLNIVAGVVTMVFLYTYGMTNLAAFVELRGSNPSFRPRFKFVHWSGALLGALACVWVAFMINVLAAFVALAFIGLLFLVVRQREMAEAYGDARRGFVYSRVITNLLQLAGMPVHPKNWRPTVLVLSGDPASRMGLVDCARWIGEGSGVVSLLHVVESQGDSLVAERRQAQIPLDEFTAANRLPLFTETVVVADFDGALPVILQSFSLGPLKPNVVLLGWPRDRQRLAPYFNHLRTIIDLEKSVVVYLRRELDLDQKNKRIDLWWRGHRNGSLMVILAHLIMLNHDWRRTRIRLLRQVGTAAEVVAARQELEGILQEARIDAEVEVAVSSEPFATLLRQHSADASLLLLGLNRIDISGQEEFFANTLALLDGMPGTLLVHSSGEADLTA